MLTMKLLSRILLFCAIVQFGWAKEAKPFSCGKVLVGRHQNLIANTNDAPPGAWPWHAAIYHVQHRGQAEYKCGGTLISENVILTAAHCMIDTNTIGVLREEDYVIHLGKHKLSTVDENTVEFKVSRAIQHEDYKQNTLANDIGLLKLDGRVTFSDYIQPICLWNDPPIESVHNQSGFVAGWGHTEQGNEPAEVLRETQMPVVDSIICLQSNRVVFGQFLWSFQVAIPRTTYSLQMFSSTMIGPRRKVVTLGLYCQDYDLNCSKV